MKTSQDQKPIKDLVELFKSQMMIAKGRADVTQILGPEAHDMGGVGQFQHTGSDEGARPRMPSVDALPAPVCSSHNRSTRNLVDTAKCHATISQMAECTAERLRGFRYSSQAENTSSESSTRAEAVLCLTK